MKQQTKHARFFALLKHMPGTTKEDLVWQYSNMLTESLSEFFNKNPAGYKRMLIDMQASSSNQNSHLALKASPKDVWAAKKLGVTIEHYLTVIKRLRSAIFTRLQKHGVDTTDMNKTNRFLENPRIAGKRLYDLTEAEMRVLIPKLESILKKDKQQQADIARLTQLN